MNKPQTLTEKKRIDIVKAAQEEFKEKGFVASSMDSLAKRAEVSKRTVYNHFPSKEALFHAIVQQLCDSFTQAASIEYKDNLPLKCQLLEVAKNELDLFKSDKFRDLNRITLAEIFRSTELAASTFESMAERGGGLSVWISAAIKDGRLKEVDPEYAAKLFLGLIKSTSFWPQLLMGQEFPSKSQQKVIAEDAVFMFLSRFEVSI